MHTPPPSIPCSLEYARNRQSRQLLLLSERTAASLNVYYGKSAALALILSQEAPKQLASSVVMGGFTKFNQLYVVTSQVVMFIPCALCMQIEDETGSRHVIIGPKKLSTQGT